MCWWQSYHKALLIMFIERKKWIRNGSRVEPFSCSQDGPHLGTALQWNQNGSTVEPKQLHFLKSGTVFNLFSTFQPPLWSRFGKQYHFGQKYRFFLKHFKKWSRFPQRLQGGAILAPLLFSVFSCDGIIKQEYKVLI